MTKLFDITPIRKPTHSAGKPLEKTGRQSPFYFVALATILIFVFSIIQNTNKQNQSLEPQVSDNQLTQDQEQKDEKDLSVSNNQSVLPILPDNSNTNQLQPNQTFNKTNQDTQINKSQMIIQILNGSGVDGVASQTKKILEKDGYTINSIGTARNIYSTSVIYHNKGKEAEAHFVSESIPRENIKTEENSELTKGYDLVIVVGRE